MFRLTSSRVINGSTPLQSEGKQNKRKKGTAPNLKTTRAKALSLAMKYASFSVRFSSRVRTKRDPNRELYAVHVALNGQAALYIHLFTKKSSKHSVSQVCGRRFLFKTFRTKKKESRCSSVLPTSRDCLETLSNLMRKMLGRLTLALHASPLALVERSVTVTGKGNRDENGE